MQLKNKELYFRTFYAIDAVNDLLPAAATRELLRLLTRLQFVLYTSSDPQ